MYGRTDAHWKDLALYVKQTLRFARAFGARSAPLDKPEPKSVGFPVTWEMFSAKLENVMQKHYYFKISWSAEKYAVKRKVNVKERKSKFS